MRSFIIQVSSCLGSPAQTAVLMRAILSGVVNGLIQTTADARHYMGNSLWSVQNASPEAVARTGETVANAVRRLHEDKFLEECPMGMAVAILVWEMFPFTIFPFTPHWK